MQSDIDLHARLVTISCVCLKAMHLVDGQYVFVGLQMEPSSSLKSRVVWHSPRLSLRCHTKRLKWHGALAISIPCTGSVGLAQQAQHSSG